MKPLIELRVPFELSHDAIDHVERSSDDSDWQPAKEAARNWPLPKIVASSTDTVKRISRAFWESTSNPVETLVHRHNVLRRAFGNVSYGAG